MKKLAVWLAVVLSIFQVPGVLAQEPTEEVITRFDSVIEINKDTSLTISEKIEYFTPVEKHGIFRYIPEKYRREGMVYSNPISEIYVNDDEGKTLPFSISREKGNLTLKIGDPELTFSGSRIYNISYKVGHAILRQKDFDELYWDITGEGWQFPVLSSTVTVKSPFAAGGETVCFVGPVGSVSSHCTISQKDNLIKVETNEEINYGDNFTIAVKMDKNNTLIFPAPWERLIDLAKNNYFFILLVLPGLLMFFVWYKKGRDFRFVSPNVFNLETDQPKGLRPLFEPINIPMVYEPLKDLTPGEAGAMLDEKVDNQDVVAEIIDLARKKYLGIERVAKKGFLKFGHDFLLTKYKSGPGDLPPQQEYLMEHIFNSKTTVKLSELKGTFFTHMTKVKEMINERLKERKLFTANPNTTRGIWMVLAVCMSGLIFVLTIGAISFLQEAWTVMTLLSSAIIAIWFAWNMPQKTAVGTNLALQVKGLRETIRLGKWREEIKEKHLFIEEVLPFAIALGVIDKLAKDMSALNIRPPKYLEGGMGMNHMAWSGFVSDFNHAAASGLSYNPSSSSSGGSGFSGGSSGGGGGGGGGGSW
ncbi:TPA: hypothetical protein DIU27_03345 [Candidatus Collierbacteria bacterium]|uniref:DUF2207 domain-containing protein n=1 Tax=Candidatus Collierbacteria bacterium GW2011_GWB2_44_22 TaxID=1618387 RepID=A0A0G1HYJ8_9BACT|nr:MAG: hypothetical protein UW31_C0001G0008 [Candidatus Collierbacteria bacterium GW2011_GWA2_44_13]KKT49849.1 MAG: hypothetical protein UW42_C0030G0002 [Candidatus Collierbacteria bacterium GW2011_GWB1_44_197]KKT52226.1 MAG: hypothetical protein UW44_C0003G0069 [Candidatus Collierbacteria bacterium GW2011_GWB2_44_22]KKT62410.1 MAG: hypothetical protein UW56_C0007G0018 [Candidatus Collierbacteria bacterium GW2011_GWD1_44_27]KKT66832.1 MAG: hypothetical protein UW58_C0002G0017 [Candidatus Colli